MHNTKDPFTKSGAYEYIQPSFSISRRIWLTLLDREFNPDHHLILYLTTTDNRHILYKLKSLKHVFMSMIINNIRSYQNINRKSIFGM